MASSPEQGSSRESIKRKRKGIALADDESCLSGEKALRQAKFIKKINDDDRVALSKTFNKRNPTVMKKAKELQTLCDVSVCMVCYGPNGDLVTWPENEADVKNMILTYKAMNVREKGRVSLLGHLESKKRKLEEKKNKNNGGKVDELITNLENCLSGLSGDALMYTQNYLDFKLKDLKEKIEFQVSNVTTEALAFSNEPDQPNSPDECGRDDLKRKDKFCKLLSPPVDCFLDSTMNPCPSAIKNVGSYNNSSSGEACPLEPMSVPDPTPTTVGTCADCCSSSSRGDCFSHLTLMPGPAATNLGSNKNLSASLNSFVNSTKTPGPIASNSVGGFNSPCKDCFFDVEMRMPSSIGSTNIGTVTGNRNTSPRRESFVNLMIIPDNPSAANEGSCTGSERNSLCEDDFVDMTMMSDPIAANVGNYATVANKDSILYSVMMSNPIVANMGSNAGRNCIYPPSNIVNTNTSGAVLPEHFRLDATNCSNALTNIKFDNSNTLVEITGWPWDAETASDQDLNPYIDTSQWLSNEFQCLANCPSPGTEGGSNFPCVVSQANAGFAEPQNYFDQVNTSNMELENLGGAAKKDNIGVVPRSNQIPLLQEALPMSMWMLRPLL